MLPRPALAIALAILVCPTGAHAQPPPRSAVRGEMREARLAPFTVDTPPAYVAVVAGTAWIEREGRVDDAPLNMPLAPGDRLRTADGRLEARLADGNLIDLDARTTVDLQSDDLVRLLDGRVRVTILRSPRLTPLRVDSPAGSARVSDPGEYQVAMIAGGDGEPQLELAVFRGVADILTEQGSTSVVAGERAYAAAGLLPSRAYAFDTAAMDDFDRWPALGAQPSAPSVSTQYLPSDLQPYAPTFDAYGDWSYAPVYGYVWYPRVTTEWRPYRFGRWLMYRRFGLTWVGTDPFAWPTHHYGRWGVRGNVWFWIPERTWGPAYVSWAYSPDSVTWCPLGFDNRPVTALNGRVVPSSSGVAPPAVGGAWTVVSRPRFEAQVRGLAQARPLSPVAAPRQRVAPRYVNRGDEIIRSQTARAVAPTMQVGGRKAAPGSRRLEDAGQTSEAGGAAVRMTTPEVRRAMPEVRRAMPDWHPPTSGAATLMSDVRGPSAAAAGRAAPAAAAPAQTRPAAATPVPRPVERALPPSQPTAAPSGSVAAHSVRRVAGTPEFSAPQAADRGGNRPAETHEPAHSAHATAGAAVPRGRGGV